MTEVEKQAVLKRASKKATKDLIERCREVIAATRDDGTLREELVDAGRRLEESLEAFLVVCGDPNAPEPQGKFKVTKIEVDYSAELKSEHFKDFDPNAPKRD